MVWEAGDELTASPNSSTLQMNVVVRHKMWLNYLDWKFYATFLPLSTLSIYLFI